LKEQFEKEHERVSAKGRAATLALTKIKAVFSWP
jgi:hypothetical protein